MILSPFTPKKNRLIRAVKAVHAAKNRLHEALDRQDSREIGNARIAMRQARTEELMAMQALHWRVS